MRELRSKIASVACMDSFFFVEFQAHDDCGIGNPGKRLEIFRGSTVESNNLATATET